MADDGMYLDIVFDGPPGPESGRFVEVETSGGKSVTFGVWVKRADGYWALRFDRDDACALLAPPVRKLAT